MLSLDLFFKSFILGLCVAAPVGPIGLLCIRRTLVLGFRHGMMTGLGAATADAIYGCTSVFGLTVVSSTLLTHEPLFHTLGSAFLGILGLKIFFSKTEPIENGNTKATLVGSFLSSLLLTIANPATILSFAAAFASLGLIQEHRSDSAGSLVVLGVFSGSAIWWLILSGSTGRFRELISIRVMNLINRVSGLLILALAVSTI